MQLSEGRSEPLGATVMGAGVNFAVWSAHATAVEVSLFDGDRETRFALPGRTGNVFHGHISGIADGTRYGLRVHGPDAPGEGHRFSPDKLLLDPYALQIDRAFLLMHEMFAGDSARVMPKAVVTAPVSAPLPPQVPWDQTVIYELHVRGFTRLMPEIPEAMRGTFAGLAHPAAVAHLKRLGVTTVELLPCMAWIDETHLKRKGLTNYWGYNPVAWCAPDPRLAPGGWDEVRNAVTELGKAGIEVILDVVYNHSGEGDELGPVVSLRGLDNAGYYRLAEDKSLYVNDAGTGNILNCDHPAVVRLVMDSLRAWAVYGGMAGFRFDLATTLGRRREGFDPASPLLSAIIQDPLLRTRKLVAEPWDCGPGGYQLGAFGAPWAEWNDRFRDDIRRFWRGDGMGLGQLARRLSGSQDTFGARPAWSSINFVAAHDGFTLADLVGFDRKQNEANGEANRDGNDENFSWVSNDPARDQRNLLATLFAARGTPMLAMGSESGHSQAGNNNAYAQDNVTSWLDWAVADEDLIAFTARLIALRREHPALRGDWLSGAIADGDRPDVAWTRGDGVLMDPGSWDDPNGPVLVMTLSRGEDRVCVVVNRGGDTEVRLPPCDSDRIWRLALDTADDGRGGDAEDAVAIAAGSVAILVEAGRPGRKAGLDDAVLDALAEGAGIQPFWWSVDGRQTFVPRDSKLAILRALGLPCGNNREARDSLRGLAERFDRPILPPAHVHHGEGPVVIPIGGATTRWLEAVGEDKHPCYVQFDNELKSVRGRDGRMAETRDAKLGPLPPGRYTLRDQDGRICRLTVAPERAFAPLELVKGLWGLSAQLYALRRTQIRNEGDQGMGDLTTLGRLLVAARDAGAACVAINPLHALFPNNRDRASPYYPSDRRFIDPLWIDTGEAADDGPVIDYAAVWARKHAALRARFTTEYTDPGLAAFVEAGGDALHRFAVHQAGDKAGDISYHKYLQWLAERQLEEATKGGAGMAVGLMRDLAIGAAPDGAEAVLLGHMMAQGVSLGAPPDPFSAEGQVWGIPPFSPHALTADGYDAIAGIYRANMRHAGALRIDHAIGLMRQFWVPAGAEGKDGAYVRFPYADLLGQLKLESTRAKCLVVGEDLGTVAEGFREAMNGAGILSYKVMPFERESLGFRPSSSYPRDAVACVATHDLPPLKGWWNGSEIRERHALGLVPDLDAALAVRRAERDELLSVLDREDLLSGGDADGPLTMEIAAAVHAFIARAPSLLAVAQIEDLAAMELPINLPGTDRERPNWRHRLPDSLESVFESDWAQALLAAIRVERAQRLYHRPAPFPGVRKRDFALAIAARRCQTFPGIA